MVLILSFIIFILVILVIMQAFKIHAAQEEVGNAKEVILSINQQAADFEQKWHRARDENGRLVDVANDLQKKLAAYRRETLDKFAPAVKKSSRKKR